MLSLIHILRGRLFYGTVIVLMVFRAGLFSAVQLQDRSDPDFPDTLLRVRLLAVVLPAAQFAFYLDMCALGERLGELRELAEDDATVPFLSLIHIYHAKRDPCGIFQNRAVAADQYYVCLLYTSYKANQAPFDIQSIYHDDKFTYIKTNAPEKFSVYEMKDGNPNLVTYDLREGTYIIPKVMDDGYVELGKKRMSFTRKG